MHSERERERERERCMCGVLEHYEVPQRMVMGIERMPMDAMNVFFSGSPRRVSLRARPFRACMALTSGWYGVLVT